MCSIRIVDNKSAKRKEIIGQDGLLPMVLPESGVGASGDDVGPPVAHARVQPAHAVAAHLQPNAINYFLIFLYHLLTEIKQISYFMYTLLPKHASHPRVASVHSTCVVESGDLGRRPQRHVPGLRLHVHHGHLVVAAHRRHHPRDARRRLHGGRDGGKGSRRRYFTNIHNCNVSDHDQ